MSDQFKILFLGDIFAEAGRKAVTHFVPKLREELDLDLVLANCENAAHGRGMSKRLVYEITDAGVDFMTSGNHIFDVAEIMPYMNQKDSKILRPYNFSKSSPGRGAAIVEARNGIRVGVINVMGRLFMEPGVDLPFDAVDEAILDLQGDCDVMALDMHAETTSEKRAMGWHVDSRVQLMVGTHTHVPTADEEILPGGTAYITDLGMCGPYDSVIGMEKTGVIKRFRTGLRHRFEVASKDVRLCGVVATINLNQKRAVAIERICKRMNG